MSVLGVEATLLGLGLALSLVFSVWRISGHVRRIRELLERELGGAATPPTTTPMPPR